MRITERNALGAITSDHCYIWDGLTIAKEHDASTNQLLRRFFTQGTEVLASSSTLQPFLYTRDHLSSIRKALDTTVPSRSESLPPEPSPTTIQTKHPVTSPS